MVDLWHDSQVAVVAMWLPDFPVATVPLWQLAQLVVTPGTLAWYLAGNQVVYPLLWQVVQLAVDETWFVDLPVAVVPLWQVEQFVAAVNVL